MNFYELIKSSWLNNFLYNLNNLVIWYLEEKKYIVIQLWLSIKEIAYIKNNYSNFVKILETILFTYNQSWNNYFNNITFWNIKKWSDIFNNCIFLYSSNKDKKWYRDVKSLITIKENIKKDYTKLSIYQKIILLIKNKKLSVRNLIKIWIIQIRAREIYNFLKEKWVFEISKYNNNNKIYHLENINNFTENDINAIISGSV